jgi:hypothetical protein
MSFVAAIAMVIEGGYYWMSVTDMNTIKKILTAENTAIVAIPIILADNKDVEDIDVWIEFELTFAFVLTF